MYTYVCIYMHVYQCFLEEVNQPVKYKTILISTQENST